VQEVTGAWLGWLSWVVFAELGGFRLSQIPRMDTVAEGIEGAAQAIELTLLGCRTAQGHHFSRPQPAAEIERLLRQSTAAV
jgi:EAL domain-containing protein (putative c-di-GMP-specific phosphodiesterase class I)